MLQRPIKLLSAQDQANPQLVAVALHRDAGLSVGCLPPLATLRPAPQQATHQLRLTAADSLQRYLAEAAPEASDGSPAASESRGHGVRCCPAAGCVVSHPRTWALSGATPAALADVPQAAMHPGLQAVPCHRPAMLRAVRHADKPFTTWPH